MISKYKLEKLEQNNVKDITSLSNVIREECQKIVLFSLAKTTFFNNVAFYGGTCLRIFHNLDRFSEDLDFAVTKEDVDINLDEYMPQCILGLESFGIKAYITSKESYDKGEIRRRYFKIPFYNLVKEYLNIEINPEQNLSIKLEVSTIYVPNAITENKLLNSPQFVNVKCYDYPTLFAGKLNALICRNWRSREKGRDYYDFMFYISQNVKFNISYFKSKLSLSLDKDCSNLELKDVKEMIISRLNDTDYDSVKKDIIDFVDNPSSLDSIQKELFISAVDLIQCC